MRKYVAEAIGTFVLVACGCGTAVAMGCNSAMGDAAYMGTALAFGLSIVAMAYSIGNVSGCHVNPAVSLALFIDGRLSFTDLVGYVAGQIIGAFWARPSSASCSASTPAWVPMRSITKASC
jgi:aquaporin Z